MQICGSDSFGSEQGQVTGSVETLMKFLVPQGARNV
jgi:hypothetical protein